MGAGPIIVSGDVGAGPPMVVPKDNTVTILLIVLVVVVVVVGVVVALMFSREGRGRYGYGPPYYPEPVSMRRNPLYEGPIIEAS
jgi:heme/copper-type cytochrome/quinol oxidase subunit 2